MTTISSAARISPTIAPIGAYLQRAALQLGEVDVEHHHDEEEEHRDRADIDDEQDHRQELGAGEQEQAGRVDEGQDQIEHRMHGVARGDDHEGRSDRDEGEEVEKYRFNSVEHG